MGKKFDDKKKKTKKQEAERFPSRRLLIAVLIFILVVGAAVPLTAHFYQKNSARNVLRQAKNANLAVKMVGIEYYGEGKRYFIPSNKNGLADGVAKRIRDVADCKGDVYVLDWDAENQEALELLYVEGSYYAVYIQEGDKQTWNVYRSRKLL